MHVIVVGSGAAGLMTAYRAATLGHEVTLVTKADLPESNTRYAQGGIAAVLSADDTVDAHVADTLAAGAGLCDAAAVRLMCADGPDRIRNLLALGLELDRVAGSGSALAACKEGAHSSARVVHSHGDSTGLSLEIALIDAVKSLPIQVWEHLFLADLIVTGLERRVIGCVVVGPNGVTERLYADAVVLATGGGGRLFAHTTNPEIATGDGLAAALRAGAAVADLEFFQFHPTALAAPDTPLISEAVRGEGAVLRDATGRRFMLDVHPSAELAPRDVVARGIAAAMAVNSGAPVTLDASHLGLAHMERRFPSLTTMLARHGLTWDDPIPVTPAAHYWMGGVVTDLDGRTSLPRLFAVGEVARTGVHGANRLASNSLLEALVFGWRAANALDTESDAPFASVELVSSLRSSVASVVSESERERSTPSTPSPSETSEPQSLSSCADATNSLSSCAQRSEVAGSPNHPDLRAAIQNLMWEQVGLLRDAPGLTNAAEKLRGIYATAWQANDPTTDSIRHLEDRNLALLAEAMIAAALARTESRGGHARADFPESDPMQAKPRTWALPTKSLIPISRPASAASR